MLGSTDIFETAWSASGHLFYTDNSERARAKRAAYIQRHPEEGLPASAANIPQTDDSMNGLGFGFRSVGRGVARGARGVGHGTVAVGRAGYKVGKLAVEIGLLPFTVMLKASRVLGRAICSAPPELLQYAAVTAGVDPKFIPLFCAAVRENRLSLAAARRMLPPAIKVASALAASGAFPPIVPALAIIHAIPGLSHFAGVDLGDYGYRTDLRTIKRPVKALQQYAVLGEQTIEAGMRQAQIAMLALAAAAGFGLYLTLRKD